MRPGDLLEDTNDGSDGYNGVVLELRRDLLHAALINTVEGYDDLDLLLCLVRLLHQELQSTIIGSWPRAEISDTADQRLLFRALQRVSRRNKIDLPLLEYRDYDEFRYFILHHYGPEPDEVKIHKYLGSIFNPIEDLIYKRQDDIWESELALPISPHGGTGWKRVDDEILEMRRQFRDARSEQAHSSIGNSCNRILLFLSEAAFVPDRHLSAGEELPPVNKTKNRFDMIINHELVGPNQAELRKLVRAAVELAEAVKHGTSPSRSDAGIAADSVIMLVNILRRIT